VLLLRLHLFIYRITYKNSSQYTLMAKSRKSKGRSRGRSRKSRNASGGKNAKKPARRIRRSLGSRSARALAPAISDISDVRTPSTIASNMSLTQLQNAAAARGIPFGGLNKDALVQRINKYA